MMSLLLSSVSASAILGLGGGGSGNAHRYWRIYDGGHEYPFINEIEFRETVGGADWTNVTGNVIFGQGGSGSNLPINAFDNNDATYWQGQTTTPSQTWIGWDLGAGNTKEIGEVRTLSTAGITKDRFYMGMIQYSDDGSDWRPWGLYGYPTTLPKGDNTFVPNTTALGERGVIGTAYRYWEVLCWGRGNRGDFYQGFRELDLLDEDLAISLNKTYGGTATDNDARFPAINPWDGVNLETNNTEQMYWNRFDFGAGNERAAWGLKVQAANNGSVTPAGAIVRASNDGTNWFWFYSWEGLTWGNNQVRQFNFIEMPGALYVPAGYTAPTIAHTYSGVATTTSGAFNFPPGDLQTDDIILFAETWDGDTGGSTLAGFTTVASDFNSFPSYTVQWSRVGATPPTSITPQRASIRDTAWGIYIIRNASVGASPFDATTLSQGFPTPAQPPQVSTAVRNSTVVTMAFFDDSNGTVDTFPGGFTSTLEQQANLPDQQNAALGMAALEDTVGPVTPGIFDGATLDEDWRAVSLYVSPFIPEPDLTVSDVSSSTIFGPSADILVSDVSGSTIFGPSADIVVSDVSSTTIYSGA